MCVYIQYIKGGQKETLPTSALLASVPVNRSRLDYKYSYLKVCAQDSVNGNTVTVIVTETRKC